MASASPGLTATSPRQPASSASQARAPNLRRAANRASSGPPRAPNPRAPVATPYATPPGAAQPVSARGSSANPTVAATMFTSDTAAMATRIGRDRAHGRQDAGVVARRDRLRASAARCR